MRKIKDLIYITIITATVMLLASGCAATKQAISPQDPPATVQEEPVSLPTEPAVDAAPTEAATVAEPTPAPPTAEPATEPEPIKHILTPGDPAFMENQLIPECDTYVVYKPGQALAARYSCHVWKNNLIEIPFDPTGSIFFPYLDITSAISGYKDAWIYFQVDVYENLPGTEETVNLAIELDIDLDGKGDYLVLLNAPGNMAADWSVEGLQVWQDANKDLGSGSNGDGYEQMLFDSGRGDDPDLAWSRKGEGKGAVYQFAVKDALLGGSKAFAWSGWIYGGSLDPAAFALPDTFKDGELSGMDNTCVKIFGTAKMNLPNLCSTAETEAPKKKNSCVKPPQPDKDIYGHTEWNQSLCKWIAIN